MATKHTHYRTCNLCEAMCGLEIQYDLETRQIHSIRGDTQDPFSQGDICPKAVALKDIYEDPDRLRYPIRRTSNGWERLGWDDALQEVTQSLQRIQAKQGANAVGLYIGNPYVHNFGAQLFTPGFVRSLKTRNRFSATSVDQLPHQLVSYLLFGNDLLMPVPDIDQTDFFLILGANPVASNGSLMTAPGVRRRLKALRERGGKLIVIDPRRTETAELADTHHFIRPGSDVLLMLALLHTVFSEGLMHLGKFETFTDGIATLQDLTQDFPPERIAEKAGIPALEIRQLARDFVSARSAVCYGRMGVSTQEFGTAVQWLIVAFNIVTGKMDQPGGFMFAKPAVDIVAMGAAKHGKRGHFNKWQSRVRQLPEFGGELPVATLAEEILTPGEGQIHAMVTLAGNPVLSTPNGEQLDRALSELDFMVSIDIYLNETTRHAHIILPPTTALEHDHYDLTFHLLAVRNTAKYSPALFPPSNTDEDADTDIETRHDWQILLELQHRMQSENGELNEAARNAILQVHPHQFLKDGLKHGPYASHLSWERLQEASHGIDLGPLEPCLPERLFSDNQRIDLAQTIFTEDIQRIRNRFFQSTLEHEEATPFDLTLIGRRHLRSNNSWMHNSPRLVKGKPRCTVLMHPDDAAERDIADGNIVTVSTRVGSIQLPAELTDSMMPRVISIPHGWGHDRSDIQLSTAQKHAGVSVNDLTDETLLDVVSGNAAVNGVPAKVEIS